MNQENQQLKRDNSPIFIVGANRSGTTLLRLILNAHSRIGIPEELVYFDSRLAGIPIGQWRHPGLSQRAYRAFVDRFLTKNCAPMVPLDAAELRRDILQSGPQDFRRPYQLALEHWAHSHGKVRWGEKTPGNLFYVDVIRDMFPEAQFIHLVRDPRAGVHSMNRASFLANDAIINALNRHKYVKEGLAIQEGMVSTGQWMQVRYEDLVAKPEATVQALCQFLHEPFEPAMLHFHEDAEHYMKRRASGDFNSAATRPIDQSKIEAWRSGLTRREIAAVEAICGEQMQRLGYIPEGYTLNVRTHLDMLVKRAYYQLQHWRHPQARQYLLKDRLFARSRNRIGQLFHFLRPISNN